MMKRLACLVAACSVAIIFFFSASAAVAAPLDGVVDFHVHSSPDVTPRSVDDIQLARNAAATGMKAVVMKNHLTPTGDRAVLSHKLTSEVEFFGGVVLNNSVGGLNLRAVEVMYGLSEGRGKVVWLPTVDADYHHQVFGREGKGIRVVENGQVVPQLIPILQFIAEHNLILGTAHVSPEEVLAVVQRAKELGVKRITVTHAMADVPGLSLAQMQQLADWGAYLELTYVNDLMGENAIVPAHRRWHRVSVTQMAEAIKTIGAEHFILSTDLGRSGDPLPTEGYGEFIRQLRQQDISEAEIKLMSQINPSQLLDLR